MLCSTTTSNPWSVASRSVSPVWATVRSNTRKIPVPRIPRWVSSPPVIASPAIRPILFAVDPSGRHIGAPVITENDSATSPTAQMPGTLVAIRSSTAIAPDAPRVTPACTASSVVGPHAHGRG